MKQFYIHFNNGNIRTYDMIEVPRKDDIISINNDGIQARFKVNYIYHEINKIEDAPPSIFVSPLSEEEEKLIFPYIDNDLLSN